MNGDDIEPTASGEEKRVVLPLVKSATPGFLTNERIAEILEEEDLEYIRSFAGTLPLGGSSWTDEERDAIRAESVEALGWEGMEVYQVDASATEDGNRQ